jgi:hypothetical protein
LKEQFRKPFADLDANAQGIRLFQNPFDCDAADIPKQIQMEIIKLQKNYHIKDKYKEGNLIEFYKFLNSEHFGPHILRPVTRLFPLRCLRLGLPDAALLLPVLAAIAYKSVISRVS